MGVATICILLGRAIGPAQDAVPTTLPGEPIASSAAQPVETVELESLDKASRSPEIGPANVDRVISLSAQNASSAMRQRVLTLSWHQEAQIGVVVEEEDVEVVSVEVVVGLRGEVVDSEGETTLSAAEITRLILRQEVTRRSHSINWAFDLIAFQI